MGTSNFERIFNPGRIAVIGASDEPGSVGLAVMTNLLASRDDLDVIPVNPKHDRVRGRRAVPSIDEIEGRIDLAILCTPVETVPALIEACAKAEVAGAVILSAGFGEAGEDGAALEEQLRHTVEHSALRVLGPNCLGFISPHRAVNASFAQASALPGSVAFASQSGALCTSMLDWGNGAKLGFSHFVSLGNMLDVDFGDLIEMFDGDANTRAIVLYLESFKDAEKLLAAARRCSARKPIVACNSGRFEASAQAASSHTGAMVGEDDVLAMALRRAGIERVPHVGELFDAARLLARYVRADGPRLAIVTNAGGPGVLAADAVVEQGAELAALGQDSRERLSRALPPQASLGNPVDVLGDATPDRYTQACEAMLEDASVDAVLVILTPQAMTDALGIARSIAALADRTDKPVLAAFMGSPSVRDAVQLLCERGVPTYRTPEQAVTAFGHLVRCGDLARAAQGTPSPGSRAHDTTDVAARDAALQVVREAREACGDRSNHELVLDEAQSTRLLAAYGIPVAETHSAQSADEAVERAEKIGFPVAIKVRSTRIAHKSDVGGVTLGIDNPSAVRQAYEEVLDCARRAVSGAEREGVTVQSMSPLDGGLELILGAKRDPTFGPVVMVGLGGTTAELLRDRVLGLPPLDEKLAAKMLRDLRSWPLLEGYRGKPGVALQALTQALVRISHLALDLPGLKTLDINPLGADAQQVLVLDARIVLDDAPEDPDAER